jgi:soluble lytic murein transglycosylase-like protein
LAHADLWPHRGPAFWRVSLAGLMLLAGLGLGGCALDGGAASAQLAMAGFAGSGAPVVAQDPPAPAERSTGALAFSAIANMPATPMMVAELRPSKADPHRGLDPLISEMAGRYGVPARLIHRVIRRESNYNAAARNGPYYGLMQILPQTARTMGHSGPASALLDARTNLTYGVKYLRGAWLVAGRNEDRAIQLYARGYYYDAKAKGLLKETGLRP